MYTDSEVCQKYTMKLAHVNKLARGKASINRVQFVKVYP